MNPDKLVANPVYPTAPPMPMYSTSRVEEVESTEEWTTGEAGYNQRCDANRRKPLANKPLKVQVGSGRNGNYLSRIVCGQSLRHMP